MAFNLQLSFTGIAAFIQAAEYAPVWVVMPGLEGPKDALDGEALCPHNSYIQLVGGVAVVGGNFERTSLKGQVVTFDLTYDVPGKPSYGASDLPDELIDMQVLLGDLCIVNRAILARTSPPRPAFVMTQVLLPDGEFGAPYPESGWSLEQVDTRYGSPIEDDIAHKVTLTIKNLKGASVTLEAMDGTGATSLSLTPVDAASQVDVELVNTCKELPASEERSWRDRDFKWYFELLEEEIKMTIMELIGNDDLPIPRYTAEDNSYRVTKRGARLAVVGGGHDCFPAQMAGYSYASSSRSQQLARIRRKRTNRSADPEPASQDERRSQPPAVPVEIAGSREQASRAPRSGSRQGPRGR